MGAIVLSLIVSGSVFSQVEMMREYTARVSGVVIVFKTA